LRIHPAFFEESVVIGMIENHDILTAGTLKISDYSKFLITFPGDLSYSCQDAGHPQFW
jgi:hypothetical protein